MRHLKDEVNSVVKDKECGLGFEKLDAEFQMGDTIVCFSKKMVKQSIKWDPPGFWKAFASSVHFCTRFFALFPRLDIPFSTTESSQKSTLSWNETSSMPLTGNDREIIPCAWFFFLRDSQDLRLVHSDSRRENWTRQKIRAESDSSRAPRSCCCAKTANYLCG